MVLAHQYAQLFCYLAIVKISSILPCCSFRSFQENKIGFLCFKLFPINCTLMMRYVDTPYFMLCLYFAKCNIMRIDCKHKNGCKQYQKQNKNPLHNIH